MSQASQNKGNVAADNIVSRGACKVSQVSQTPQSLVNPMDDNVPFDPVRRAHYVREPFQFSASFILWLCWNALMQI